MKDKLNIVLECYSINPILDNARKFKWLGNQQPPFLEIGNDIEFIIINIKKIKLSLEDTLEAYVKQCKFKLQFPFTHYEFITFARELASEFSKISNWLKNLQYMKDYIIAPLMVSSKDVIIGIIILDELVLKPLFKPSDVLESNTYLSQIKYNKTTDYNKNPNYDKKANSDIEWKCDILASLLAMGGNNLSAKMKLYIMNCRGYIPPLLIRRMPMKITKNKFFQKR